MVLWLSRLILRKLMTVLNGPSYTEPSKPGVSLKKLGDLFIVVCLQYSILFLSMEVFQKLLPRQEV